MFNNNLLYSKPHTILNNNINFISKSSLAYGVPSAFEKKLLFQERNTLLVNNN